MWPVKPDWPRETVESFIGVIIAITGNILISVALNVQKYAHLKIQDEKQGLFEEININHQEERRILNSESISTEEEQDEDLYDDTGYLKSRLWWFGLALMIVGEFGNFLAYGFAPASVVAPLGTVALVSNVIVAPLILQEKFRKRDLLGIVVSICGSIMVVAFSKPEESKFSPQALWEAMTQLSFIIYFAITSVAIILLMPISTTMGSKSSLIDLGLVALFGGYTVLSTKGLSSLLSLAFINSFTYLITYVLLIVLIFTAIMQIKYLNRALRRFDTALVIPTQFVLFTISAIIGSAILYHDFEDVDLWKAFVFIAGCSLTFLGVYLITSNRVNDLKVIKPISSQLDESRSESRNNGLTISIQGTNNRRLLSDGLLIDPFGNSPRINITPRSRKSFASQFGNTQLCLSPGINSRNISPKSRDDHRTNSYILVDSTFDGTSRYHTNVSVRNEERRRGNSGKRRLSFTSPGGSLRDVVSMSSLFKAFRKAEVNHHHNDSDNEEVNEYEPLLNQPRRMSTETSHSPIQHMGSSQTLVNNLANGVGSSLSAAFVSVSAIGARHSPALGLGQVMENYRLQRAASLATTKTILTGNQINPISHEFFPEGGIDDMNNERNEIGNNQPKFHSLPSRIINGQRQRTPSLKSIYSRDQTRNNSPGHNDDIGHNE